MQFKYRLAGRAARRSNLSHIVGCLPNVQFSSSKLLRMMNRCGTHSLIVLNLRSRATFRDHSPLDPSEKENEKRERERSRSPGSRARLSAGSARDATLTRAYCQIGGNLRSRRRPGDPSTVAAWCCTTRRASSRGSPRARNAPPIGAARAALLSASRERGRRRREIKRGGRVSFSSARPCETYLFDFRRDEIGHLGGYAQEMLYTRYTK